MIVEILTGFAVGFATGFAIAYYTWKTAYDKLHDASIEALKKQHESNTKAVYARVRSKIDKVDKIMEAQLNLWGQFDGPNKGAAHSRWKRGLVGQINDLEAEKMDIFKAILSDGVDLEVSVTGADGSKEKKRMSAIVKEFEAEGADDPFIPKNPEVKPTPKSTKENESNNKLKLVKKSNLSIVKGGNND